MLPLSQVLPDLKALNKKSVLEELCVPVVSAYPEVEQSVLLDVLKEREKLGSTGIGDGVAIPHGKLSVLDNIVLVFGRSKAGVDFDALDGKPTHLFFMVLAPENSASIHLKTLGHISRLLKSQVVRKELMNAKDAAQILSIIDAQEKMAG